MNIEWHGQSAFTLRGGERSVLIDPFDQRLRPEGMSIRFDYPQIPQQQVDLLLITHEHFDHNGAAVADGSPHVVRSTAGSFDGTPVGEVIAIASEHDD
ncbi:MAG TPA: MBL fold metallo-hydrolase, partial [Gaiellales bacterium]|nr:MBL fold metallo-hydrolase [Gaiellales bacterium]